MRARSRSLWLPWVTGTPAGKLLGSRRKQPEAAPREAPERGGFQFLRDEPADGRPGPKPGGMRVRLLPSLRITTLRGNVIAPCQLNSVSTKARPAGAILRAPGDDS
jgi:hypothetical protein